MRRIPVPTTLLENARAGDLLPLPAKEAHYVTKVLRLQHDRPLELFCGDGKIAQGRLQISANEVSLLTQYVDQSTKGESPLQITLFQAIPKGKRWEWILEKACELGVHRIVPLQTARTVVQFPRGRADNKLRRWQKILATAARQSERSHIPLISPPLTIQAALEQDLPAVHLVAHPRQGAPSPLFALQSAPAPPSTLGIWIGPEGGFTDEEFHTLQEVGATPITLGPRILRADTAPIVAITLAQSVLGDL